MFIYCVHVYNLLKPTCIHLFQTAHRFIAKNTFWTRLKLVKERKICNYSLGLYSKWTQLFSRRTNPLTPTPWLEHHRRTSLQMHSEDMQMDRIRSLFHQATRHRCSLCVCVYLLVWGTMSCLYWMVIFYSWVSEWGLLLDLFTKQTSLVIIINEVSLL